MFPALKKPTQKTEAQDGAATKSANVQMNILVSPAFRAAVKVRAIHEGVTANALIERVVSEYLQKQE